MPALFQWKMQVQCMHGLRKMIWTCKYKLANWPVQTCKYWTFASPVFWPKPNSNSIKMAISLVESRFYLVLLLSPFRNVCHPFLMSTQSSLMLIMGALLCYPTFCAPDRAASASWSEEAWSEAAPRMLESAQAAQVSLVKADSACTNRVSACDKFRDTTCAWLRIL